MNHCGFTTNCKTLQYPAAFLLPLLAVNVKALFRNLKDFKVEHRLQVKI